MYLICKISHDSSIIKLDWSHPSFGNLIASCSFDKKIYIWKETTPKNRFERIYDYSEHTSSVNSIAFAPFQYGLILIAGSTDGNISIHSYESKIFLKLKMIIGKAN